MSDQSLPPIVPIPNKRIVDITGQRFTRWLVLGFVGLFSTKMRAHWLCRCDCGTHRVVESCNLRNGASRSCGCLAAKKVPPLRTKQAPVRSFPEYSVWQAMRTRCSNPNVNNYHNYGARGIKVCERWDSFANFLADMGPRPTPKHSIERRDSDGDYCPENCEWVTSKVQNNNTRKNRYITFNGETLTLAQWADRLSMNPATLYYRIAKKRWPLERALTEPVGAYRSASKTTS